jgi:tetratricopeptide (TPR) repeat protein
MQEMDRKIPESVRPISNIDLSLQLGRMFYDLGETEKLRERLEWAENRGDLTGDAMMRVASTWLSTFGDTARADKVMTAALGNNPDANAYFTAGTNMFSGGAGDRAAAYFQKALELDPNHGQAIGGLMQVYESTGQFDKAIPILDKWVAEHPRDTGAKRRLEQMRARLAQRDTSSQN